VLEAKTEQKEVENITCDGTPKSDDRHASLLDSRQRLNSKLNADMKLVNDGLTLRRSTIPGPNQYDQSNPSGLYFSQFSFLFIIFVGKIKIKVIYLIYL